MEQLITFVIMPILKYSSLLLIVIGSIIKIDAQSKIYNSSVHKIIKNRINDSLQISKFYLIKNYPIKHSDHADYTIYSKVDNGQYIIRPTIQLDQTLFDQAYDIISSWKSPTKAFVQQKKGFCRILECVDRQFQNFCAKKQIKYKKIYANTFFVESADPNMLLELRDQDFVTYLEFEFQEATLEGNVSDLDLSVNTINVVHHNFPDIKGSEMVLSIKEPFYDLTDIDLVGKNIPSPLSANIIDDHTNTMATICCGAGNTSIKGRGVAPEIKITSSDVINLFPDTEQVYQELKAFIQNHSYGTKVENFYGALALAYDEHTYRNPKLVHVFSAGNMGTFQDTIGPYADITGFANLTGNFKQAKNIITVGAIDTEGNIPSFSSRGPAYDGRIKPELVAHSNIGTSNATAITSGLVSLLQQLFLRENGEIPSSALIKAILISGASDVGLPGPDYESGFGSINAKNSFDIILDNNYIESRIATNSLINYDLIIPDNVLSATITLAWSDLPAFSNSSVALMNDLDIKIKGPNNEEYLPWVLHADPSADSLGKPARYGEDHLNNVEQIVLQMPNTGEYAIELVANSLFNSFQSFAIAYHIQYIDSFVWTFPTGSDNFSIDGAPEGVFRWQSSSSQKDASLFIRNCDGENWMRIEQEVDLTRNYLNFSSADLTPGLYQADMRINGVSNVSDTFVVSPVVSLELGYNCADEALLLWSAVPNNEGYRILEWDGNQFNFLDSSIDTFYRIPPIMNKLSYYKVIPEFNKKRLGIGSTARSFDGEVPRCYINSFFSTLSEENELQITLVLGTTIGLDRIELYRKSPDGDILMELLQADIAIEHEFIDRKPDEGENKYYVILYLENGAQITSEITSIFFFNQTNVLVFPNPMLSNGGVNIFTKSFQGSLQFSLMSVTGNVLFETKLISDRDFINLSQIGITQGVYYYLLKSTDWEESGTLTVY